MIGTVHVRACGVVLWLAGACAAPGRPALQVAHLGRDGGDPAGVTAIAAAFAQHNPGHALAYLPACSGLAAGTAVRMLFVQTGRATATVSARPEPRCSELTVGDLMVLRPGASLSLSAPCGLLAFTLSNAPDDAVPEFIRPDWDPRITDTPGGCATETGAYRRILLTWRGENGPYTFHGLNAHRVRITDSFTHYHPLRGGFDEFYLVQMVQPGARILTK